MDTSSTVIPYGTFSPADAWAGRWRKFLLWAFVILALIQCGVPIRNRLHGGSTKDYPLWYDTGHLMLNHQSPYYRDYHGEFPFMYPPGAAALLAIIAPLGRLGMIVALVGLNTLAWWVCIAGSVYLVAGNWRSQHPALYLIPNIVCIAFIGSTYLEGQVAMALSACILGMLVCLRKQIAWGAGALLALAAGIKGFPICAIAYLIYRRQWKAIGYTMVFLTLLVVFLPMVFRGPGGAMADLNTWSRGMGASYTPDIIGQRKERSYTWQNGSLMSVANRLLRANVIADHDDGRPPIYLNVASLTFKQVNTVIAIVGLGMCLMYLALMPPDGARTHWTDALEGAILMILIIVFSPLSFTYNNSWLMLPVAAIVYFILKIAQTRREQVVAGAWLAVAAILLAMGQRAGFLRYVRDVGNSFWADMLILAELAWLLARERWKSPEAAA